MHVDNTPRGKFDAVDLSYAAFLDSPFVKALGSLGVYAWYKTIGSILSAGRDLR